MIVWIVMNYKLVYYDDQAVAASTTNAAWFEILKITIDSLQVAINEQLGEYVTTQAAS